MKLLLLTACPSAFLSPDLISGELIDAQLGESYEHEFDYVDNNNEVEFRLTDGDLPQGLSVLSAGYISGTPQESGEFRFEVTLIETSRISLQGGDEDNISGESLTDVDENTASGSDSEWFTLNVLP